MDRRLKAHLFDIKTAVDEIYSFFDHLYLERVQVQERSCMEPYQREVLI